MLLTIPDLLLGFVIGLIIGILGVIFVGWYYSVEEDYDYHDYEISTPLEDKDIDTEKLAELLEEYSKELKNKGKK